MEAKEKPYKIEEAIMMLRDNKETIFEIRDINEKYDWNEHMLLICVQGITGNYALQYYTKPRKGVTPYKWRTEDYIPFSEKVEWYISKLTKKEVQNSIDKLGGLR